MNIIEHLLACIAEEGVEVAKEAHKAQRFGIDDRNPLIEKSPTQRENIVLEMNDFMAVADLLVEYGIIPADWQDAAKQDAKRAKVRKYMNYARDAGALQ